MNRRDFFKYFAATAAGVLIPWNYAQASESQEQKRLWALDQSMIPRGESVVTLDFPVEGCGAYSVRVSDRYDDWVTLVRGDDGQYRLPAPRTLSRNYQYQVRSYRVDTVG